ncbi:MAG: FtsX-like permease family protein, partial [Lachnospiraceae bacterium]|nr:FtsX-like permease family protein [Lachnospiraceae bacterium]
EYENYVQQLSAISQGPDDIKKILSVLGIHESEIIEAEEQLAGARAELEAQEALLAEKETELADGKLRAEEQLTAAEQELDASEQTLKQTESELLAARAEYDGSLEENLRKIAEAYEEIEQGRRETAAMDMPEWYLLDRNTVESYVGFEQDADRMDAISQVFPGIFFLVAALVSLTTMTRMVDEERTKIGTLKALGYSTGAIAGKYIKYALYATLTGSVIGVLAGGKIFPYIVITTYKLVYSCLPEVVMPIHPVYSVLAALIAVFCTIAATFAACLKALREQPAELIRPVAPKAGKRILLERVGILWRHIGFTKKATLRNMFRYKKRFLMTVIGIGGCMALLLVGYGLKDSIGIMAHIQYGELCRYDISVSVDTRTSESERAGLSQQLGSMPGVAAAAQFRETSVDMMADGTTKSVRLIVLPDEKAFDLFFVFRDRKSGEQYAMSSEGIFISEKLANMLGVKAGDSVRLQQDTADFTEVRIGAVTENYIYHYAFMTETLYRALFSEAPAYNGCYLRLEPSVSEEEIAAALLQQYDDVTSVLVTSTLQRQIDDMLGSLNVITYVLIVCAGMLAFIVLYNLSNINITERRRELATLKVLGFYDGEVSGYVYRENVLLTLLGILLGMGLGKLLHGFVITTCEVDMVMFGHIIKPVSYLYSGMLTILFAVLIGILMHFKLKRIDMIESLKSIE